MTPLFKGGVTLRTLLYYSAIALAVCLVAGYTLFQARFLLTGPTITFIHEAQTVQHEHVVRLEGTAKNIVKLELNGRQIYTDKKGHFKESLVLENGYTKATIQVYDRYGRMRSYKKEFVYVPIERE